MILKRGLGIVVSVIAISNGITDFVTLAIFMDVADINNPFGPKAATFAMYVAIMLSNTMIPTRDRRSDTAVDQVPKHPA